MFRDNKLWAIGVTVTGPVLGLGMLMYNHERNQGWLEHDVSRLAAQLEDQPERVKRNSKGRFGARADGTTLIVTLDGVPSGNGIHLPESYRYTGYAFACDAGRVQRLLEDGATLRFEVSTNAGRKLEPLEIRDCP